MPFATIKNSNFLLPENRKNILSKFYKKSTFSTERLFRKHVMQYVFICILRLTNINVFNQVKL